MRMRNQSGLKLQLHMFTPGITGRGYSDGGCWIFAAAGDPGGLGPGISPCAAQHLGEVGDVLQERFSRRGG